MRQILVSFLSLILATRAAGEIMPMPRVVGVVPGSMLVVPVRLGDPRDRLSVPACRFEVGGMGEVELVWFSIGAGQGVRTPLRAWLGVDRTWRTVAAADAGAGDGLGFWGLCLGVPGDAQGSLWIGERLVRTRMIASGQGLGMLVEVESSPDLIAALEAEATDPFRFWHAQLVLGEDGVGEVGFGNEKLSAWARGLGVSWQLALGELRRTNPDLARTLAARLWRTAHLGGGGEVAWAVWPQSPAALNDLLEMLLDPTRTGDRRAAMVELWLEEQVRILSWMIDPFSGGRGATVGLVNLHDKAEIAWLWEQRLGAATPTELAPGEMTRVELASDGLDATWEIRTSAWTMRVPVSGGAIGLRPPGALLGPLLEDWTLESFEGRLSAASNETQVRALLYRVPVVTGREGDGATPGVLLRYEDRVRYVWRLHLEGRGDDGSTVRVWLGPQGSARHVLRCSSEGWIADDLGGGGRQPVHAIREGDRWVMQIDLPAGASEADGLLHIGLERVDARGVRSSWPAARLPWDNEPARMVFDANTWLGLGGD